MITRLQSIHKNHFLHRDIKPENLLIGRLDTSTIHVIDFGFAKKYVDE